MQQPYCITQATLITDPQIISEGSVCRPDSMDANGHSHWYTVTCLQGGWVHGGHSDTEIFTPLGSTPGYHVRSSQIPYYWHLFKKGKSWWLLCQVADDLLVSSHWATLPQSEGRAPLLTSVTFPWASRTSLSPTNSSYLSHQVLAVEDARC